MDLSSEACILNVLENYHLTLIKDVTFLSTKMCFMSGRLQCVLQMASAFHRQIMYFSLPCVLSLSEWRC